jgi:hypothetical protein
MPSLLHEGIIHLVREKPAFAADLLRDILHVAVPPFSSARLSEATLNNLVPTEYTADAVVLLGNKKPVFGIILEAQIREDPQKLFTWPVYALTARAQHRCPFVVLVVTPNDATARWAAQPIELGGGTWRALVVGPKGIPVVTDVELATREPHLAVLSVLAHGRDDDVPTAVAIATAAAAGSAGLPAPTRMLYFALIESSLGEAARKSFAMLPQGQRFFSETQRRAFAEGEAKGQAKAILVVLESRGLEVSSEQRERILGNTDASTLNTWLKKAATVASVEQLFA